MIQKYGISTIQNNLTLVEKHIENLKVKGYSLLTNVLDDNQLSKMRESLDENYILQENDLGKETLKKINEENILRCPFYYDEIFLNLFTNNTVLDIVKALIGNEVQLHLQNGVINHPNQVHHQSSWHRDLPYQEYTISKPLGVSAFYCIDPFTSETGGTLVLPYSHKEDFIPSEDFVSENQIQIVANPGDVLLFDCMVFHKSGYNSSQIIRRGINNVFVAPLLKQQIDLPRLLKGKYQNDEVLNPLLGYKYAVSETVLDYRKRKLKKVE